MESGLKIGFWNINVLSKGKMSDEAFKKKINKFYFIKIFYFYARHGYAGKTEITRSKWIFR